MSAAVHHPTTAQPYRQQAQEIVATIAYHAGSDELRASFLSPSAVRQLLTE
ncbi:MAG: hypothetical protein ACE5E7_08300 [Anaerolineae bacterium]